MRGWCTDRWNYLGILVLLKDEEGEELAADSLWGIESDSEDYIESTAQEMVLGCILAARKDARNNAIAVVL